MNYEFYADVFFLTNFYLDFLAVYAVGEILQQKKKLLRYLLCCAFCSLAGCLLFLSVENYDVYLLCVHFILNPGMTFFCFFPVKKGIYVKAFCLTYFVILLLGGGMEWTYVTIADRSCYEFCLFLMAVPIMVFLFILRRKRKNVQRFYCVRIEHGGKSIQLCALYDTGNGLMDPYVKEPVHIVSGETYEALGGNDVFSTRLIPFFSVGCQNGMLSAFTVEQFWVEEDEMKYKISPAVLAVAEDEVFQNRAYQMILNCKTMERKEEKLCT